MLTTQSTEAIREIEAAIGYTFRDKRLLVQVFTRKTYMKIDPEAPDNEVLEFYGDTLMSYHVTTYFVDKFAHMLNDGLYFMRTVEQFTEMRSHYVRNQYLTERIKQMLPPIERLLRAQNPRLELPKDNQKAYADLFESLVGAVYLDSYQDDKLIRAFILHHLNIEPKTADGFTPRTDAPQKSTRAHRAVTVLPAVSLLDREATAPPPADKPVTEPDSSLPTEEPDIAKALPPTTEPTEPSSEVSTAESGSGAATAEEPADATALTATAERQNTPVESQTTDAVPAEPVSTELTVIQPHQAELDAFCRAAGMTAPLYGEPPKNAPHARPVAACTLTYRNAKGKPIKISLNDSGRTLAEATERVAAKMLQKLREQIPQAEIAEVKAPAEAIETSSEVTAEALQAASSSTAETIVAQIESPMEQPKNPECPPVPEEPTSNPIAGSAEAPPEAPAQIPIEASPKTAKSTTRRGKKATVVLESAEPVDKKVVSDQAETAVEAVSAEPAPDIAKPTVKTAKRTVKATSDASAKKPRTRKSSKAEATPATEKTDSGNAKDIAVSEAAGGPVSVPVAEVTPSEKAPKSRRRAPAKTGADVG